MRVSYFDIETAPLPDDQLEKVKPLFSAPANYKDPYAIGANIQEQETKWKERAALDATTGKVLAIGILDGNMFDVLSGDEKKTLTNFWMWLDTMQLQLGHTVVGFAVFHFDLPFLARRSWINGVPIPMNALRNHRWQPWHENIMDIAANWQCGNKEQRVSLDVLAKSLGIGSKTGTGADFAKLYAEDRDAAESYLRNDLELTKRCWERMNPQPTAMI